MVNNKKFFILTGDPGVGKTTMTVKLASFLSKKGIKTTGFYTEEVRNNRIREGFDVVTFEGKRGSLARDQTLLSGPSKHKVGKYGVMIKELENVALLALVVKPDSSEKQLLVIDEIGKMEMLSVPFKEKIRDIFSPTCSYPVLATIPVRNAGQLVEGIRNNSQSKVWTITRENRNLIHDEILKEIQSVLQL